jgi:hypothetical protein
MASGLKRSEVEVVLRWYVNKVVHCGTSSQSGHMLVCFVVIATGVVVAWL